MKKEKSQVQELPLEYSDWSRLEQTKYVVEKCLSKNHITSQDKAISNKDLLVKIKKMFKDHDIPDNTFHVSLSMLVKSKSSNIINKGRRQGYYLSNIVENFSNEKPESKKNKEREKVLYPVFLQWMFTQGYQKVKDTSSSKNQDLGTWGNPDITGLKIHETIGKTTDLEFATIEVKASIDNWKYNIFEAIAHKRFSNRCYFAFAYPEDALSKIDQDLRHYGEIYNIGILVLPLSNEMYEKLISKSEKNNLNLDEYSSDDIIEYYSAPYSNTQFHFRNRFLTAVGIKTESELHNWGQFIE